MAHGTGIRMTKWPVSPGQKALHNKFMNLPQVDLEYLDDLALDMKLDRLTLDKFIANERVLFSVLIKINDWMIKIQGKK